MKQVSKLEDKQYKHLTKTHTHTHKHAGPNIKIQNKIPKRKKSNIVKKKKKSSDADFLLKVRFFGVSKGKVCP